MTCKDCGTNVYNMACIDCAARHCRMKFYKADEDKWWYVKAIAIKHGHEPRKLAEKVKEIGNAENRKTTREMQGAGTGRQHGLF